MERLVHHETTAENARSICERGFYPEPNFTLSESDLDGLPETNRRIDEQRPEGAPERTSSTYFSLGGGLTTDNAATTTGVLKVDLERVPDDCECAVVNAAEEATVREAIMSDIMPTEDAVDQFWEEAEICEPEECWDPLQNVEPPRYGEVFCGCYIPPEAIESCEIYD